MITKRIRHKDQAGNITEVEIGADAKNVAEDDTHRFVSDTEKNTWNGKVSATGGETAETKVGSFSTSTASFPVPAAGESTKTLWGKVKKFFEDLNNLRASMLFVGSIVNNCVTNNGQLPLSAAQGKVLMDLYNVLNTKKIMHFSISRVYGPSLPGDNSVVLSDVMYTIPQGYRAFYVIMVYFGNEATAGGTVTIGVSENDVNSELVRVGATAKNTMVQCCWHSGQSTRLRILMRQSTGKNIEKPLMYINGLIIKDI